MAGSPLRTSAQSRLSTYATAFMRRVARPLVLRAAVSGRISWSVALLMLNKIGGGAA